MPLLPTLGRTVGTGVKAVRMVVRGSLRGGAWATRRVGTARARGAANEVGMIRLFDLHAVSCAGDALIAIGLAGTIFSVPLGEARGKVGLYLLITMVPFALLAPVVGPLLDHFRHGRRYALAVTMLGRAFLAYVMSDNLLGWGLYPAAFGVLALSRAYGVARSAAVPRLLPAGVGLSQVGARASVYGTFAGAVVAPIGLLAFRFGPQWPMRVATLIFLAGMVVALRLPPRADSDPPEAMPRAWRTVLGLNRGSDRPLSGRLVLATLVGSAGLRLLYGFLLLYLTFAIMAGDLDSTVLGLELNRNAAVGLVGGALALGTFLSTAAGTGLRIRRPLALQASGLVVTAGVAILATVFYNLATITLLALLTATFSGIAKLAVDASIQERVPERLRATAFAHSETVLMLAWVTGGGIGLIPLAGRLGIGLAAALAAVTAGRAAWSAARLHNERLAGRPETPSGAAGDPAAPGPAADAPDHPSGTPTAPHPDEPPALHEAADPWPEAPTVPERAGHHPPAPRRAADRPRAGTRDFEPFGDPADPALPRTRDLGTPGGPGARGLGTPGARDLSTPGDPRTRDLSTPGDPGARGLSTPGDRGARDFDSSGGPAAGAATGRRTDPTLVEPPRRRGWWPRRRTRATDRPSATASSGPAATTPTRQFPAAGEPAGRPTGEPAGRPDGAPGSGSGGAATGRTFGAGPRRPASGTGPGADDATTHRFPGDAGRGGGASATGDAAQSGAGAPATDRAAAPPGFHVYRPSSAAPATPSGETGPTGEQA
ncbi:MFS transporter [Actinoplanes teichomyceticus]|uniref:MFS transporter n=1 Tax=Actinoplanes teichomyceticus TaxID=1867 RepID=A0A561WSD5_ACTTI|nr:MFS transporter [Actinoplanes teichomyceticus]GIF15183.1 hypothetical protein Ate01nite_52150 [Actinoplanes teichomyceticus]